MGTSTVEDTPATTASTRLRDRRRPGRMDFRNPALVALLRDSSRAVVEPDPFDSSDLVFSEDTLGPARGIALGVVISGVAWTVIVASIWMLLRTQG